MMNKETCYGSLGHFGTWAGHNLGIEGRHVFKDRERKILRLHLT